MQGIEMERLKNAVKPMAWIALAVVGFAYDWCRFARHGGARHAPSTNRRQYSVTKVYHRLEKSLALKGRVLGRGRAAVSELVGLLRPQVGSGQPLQYQEAVGLKVLSEFIDEEASHSDYSAERKMLATAYGQVAEDGGATVLAGADFARGQLADPASFFGSRHTLRDFEPHAVTDARLREAVTLALSTPSVCNRQGWHVYRTSDRATISKALSFQNGNQGFSDRIPTLLIITADLNAFDTSTERYQHWIDGGMFAMTLVWAFHAMGLGSCCLNWSKGVKDDLRFRRALRIAPNHSILMMLAVGDIPAGVTVCASPRTPIDQKILDLVLV